MINELIRSSGDNLFYNQFKSPVSLFSVDQGFTETLKQLIFLVKKENNLPTKLFKHFQQYRHKWTLDVFLLTTYYPFSLFRPIKKDIVFCSFSDTEKGFSLLLHYPSVLYWVSIKFLQTHCGEINRKPTL